MLVDLTFSLLNNVSAFLDVGCQNRLHLYAVGRNYWTCSTGQQPRPTWRVHHLAQAIVQR